MADGPRALSGPVKSQTAVDITEKLTELTDIGQRVVQ